jgi:hypothetical protein
MKTYVVIRDGEVVGTARIPEPGEAPEGAPAGGRPTPSPGQTVREMDLSDEILSIKDVKEFHEAIRKSLSA